MKDESKFSLHKQFHLREVEKKWEENVWFKLLFIIQKHHSAKFSFFWGMQKWNGSALKRDYKIRIPFKDLCDFCRSTLLNQFPIKLKLNLVLPRSLMPEFDFCFAFNQSAHKRILSSNSQFIWNIDYSVFGLIMQRSS